ncbi:MAG: nucleotidyltransferase [Hungatella sp.]|nr:nucleotidyltransferase [Hungatella sp.]
MPTPHAVGVIAEYNPFHNGHAFHLSRSKSLTGADYTIAVMSGDFVQRGAPAIYDKYLRTRMALLNGADLVLELPPAFAVSSAEDFAACGVSLLDRLGVVSHLCFGSECGQIKPLAEMASLLLAEPPSLSQAIREQVSRGIPYPRAREAAAAACLSSRNQTAPLSSLLSSPNNILGIEYLKALQKRGSSIIPVTIPRTGAGYHEETLTPTFSSASAVRKTILEQEQAPSSPDIPLTGHIPPSCLKLIRSATPLAAQDFSPLLSYRLLELQRQAISPENFADISPQLSARIQKQQLHFASFENRVSALKTRQYTYTRISRCLMHILLHITAEDVKARRQADYVSYVRVLGFRNDAVPLLGAIKKASGLPLITKTADAPRLLSPEILEQFRGDLFCSHIYQSVLEQKSHIRPANEYTRSVVLV